MAVAGTAARADFIGNWTWAGSNGYSIQGSFRTAPGTLTGDRVSTDGGLVENSYAVFQGGQFLFGYDSINNTLLRSASFTGAVGGPTEGSNDLSYTVGAPTFDLSNPDAAFSDFPIDLSFGNGDGTLFTGFYYSANLNGGSYAIAIDSDDFNSSNIASASATAPVVSVTPVAPVAAVPEPGSLALVAGAGLAAGVARRRRAAVAA